VSAISVRVRTMNCGVAPLEQHFFQRTQQLSATDDTSAQWPRPPQCSHFSVVLSSTLERMRWRDISSSPKCEMWPT